MKNCARDNCLQINPQSIEQFCKDKSKKDGLRIYCKSCEKEHHKIYYSNSENKQKHKNYQTNYRANPKKKYKTYILNSKHRKIEFKLNFEEFESLISKSCYYCASIDNVGIDRLDSNVGYTQVNCVSCCSMCNVMKNDFSFTDFINKVKLIAERF